MLTYTVLSLVAISLLMFRRMSSICGRAELGGPKGPAMVSAAFMILLWIIYVTLSALQAYGVIEA